MAKFGIDKYGEDYLEEYEEEIEEVRNERLEEAQNIVYEEIIMNNEFDHKSI